MERQVEGKKEMHTDRCTIERQTDLRKGEQTYIKTAPYIWTDRQIDNIQTDIQIYMWTYAHTYRQTGVQIEGKIGTDKYLKEKQINRFTCVDMDKRTDTHKNTYTSFYMELFTNRQLYFVNYLD
jgi:hypothetical protein